MSKFKIINIIFIVGFISGLFFLNPTAKIVFVVLWIFSWLTLTSIGSFHIRWNYFVSSLHKGNTSEKIIAITFDDGPTEYTDQALDLLHKNKAKASFFLIGKNAEQYPEKVKQIIENGHTIANHTYSHSNQMGFFSSEKIKQEIAKCNEIISKISGKKLKLFRPPFGVTNPNIASGINQTKMQSIGWNIRSLDTIIEDENQLFNRIEKRIKPGSILLLHDTSQKTIHVLERLLFKLKELNYKTVTIEELLNIKAYDE